LRKHINSISSLVGKWFFFVEKHLLKPPGMCVHRADESNSHRAHLSRQGRKSRTPESLLGRCIVEYSEVWRGASTG